MSDGNKAVFLSYASQDAEAAKKICEALRAAGVEVWFDQSELVGGDAWDQKIRKQIKECALLIPVISANTQSRAEGYFRLEWRLADQRTHLMGRGRTFLLPVCIDDTKDADADVPDSFSAVQWTRLPGGEASAAFAARVKKLLTIEVETGRPRPAQRDEGVASPVKVKAKPVWPWLVLAVIAAVAAYFIFKPRRSPEEIAKIIADAQGLAAKTTKDAVTASENAGSKPEVARLLAQVRALAGKTDVLRTELDTATDLLGQAAKLDSVDAAVWAEWALVDCRYIDEYYDQSPARLDTARRHAAQATGLDPKDPMTRFAQACVMLRLAHDASTKTAAAKILEPLLAEIPDRGPVLLELGWLAYNYKHPEEALEWFDRAALIPGDAGRAHFAKAIAFIRAGFLGKGEAELDRALQSERPAKFLLWKAYLLTIWEGDTTAAGRILEEVPPGVLVEDMPATARYYVALLSHDYDLALAAIRAVPHDYLQSRAITGPSGYFKGCALALAGKPAAAELEWRSGLAVVERRLATEPNDLDLMGDQVQLQVLLGDRAAALPTWKALQELYGQQVQEDGSLQMLMLPSDQALAWAAKEVSQGSVQITAARLRLDPVYNPIRSLLGFPALLAQAEADPRLSPTAAEKPVTAPVPVDEKSVAVLAFTNLSDDKGNEYFSDGISEELLNVLCKVPGLKVTARTSSFFFKGKNLPISEIAAKLNVAYVIEGSVQRAGDTVRITAQLIKASDGYHVWSDHFDRDLKNVFALQDEIAGLIAQNLSLKLGASSAASTVAVNPQAFELYVQGRQAWNLRTAEGFDRAEQLLNRAIELAPDFARARAALADVALLRAVYGYSIGSFGQRDSPELVRIAAQIRRVLELDPGLAEAHASLGLALMHEWKLPEAERELRQAIALNSNYASAHHWLGLVLFMAGRNDDALAETKLSAELDPLSPAVLGNYGWALRGVGRPREALAVLDRALALQPGALDWLAEKALALVALGRFAEAVAVARHLPVGETDTVGCQIVVFGQSGMRTEAETLLAGLQQRRYWPRSYLLLAVGHRDEALAALDAAGTVGSDDGLPIFCDPLYDLIRDDPRFGKYLATLGWTEAHARAQAWRRAQPPEKLEATK